MLIKNMIVSGVILVTGVAHGMYQVTPYSQTKLSYTKDERIANAAYFKVVGEKFCYEGPSWLVTDQGLSLKLAKVKSNEVDKKVCVEHPNKDMVIFYDCDGKELVIKDLAEFPMHKQLQRMHVAEQDSDAITMDELCHAAYHLLDHGSMADNTYKIASFDHSKKGNNSCLSFKNSFNKEIVCVKNRQCDEAQFGTIKKTLPHCNFSAISYPDIERVYGIKHEQKDEASTALEEQSGKQVSEDATINNLFPNLAAKLAPLKKANEKFDEEIKKNIERLEEQERKSVQDVFVTRVPAQHPPVYELSLRNQANAEFLRCVYDGTEEAYNALKQQHPELSFNHFPYKSVKYLYDECVQQNVKDHQGNQAPNGHANGPKEFKFQESKKHARYGVAIAAAVIAGGFVAYKMVKYIKEKSTSKRKKKVTFAFIPRA